MGGWDSPFGRRLSNLEWSELGALQMSREKQVVVRNSTESMFWGHMKEVYFPLS